MPMFVAGEWQDKPRKIDVRNPYNGDLIDQVPAADNVMPGPAGIHTRPHVPGLWIPAFAGMTQQNFDNRIINA